MAEEKAKKVNLKDKVELTVTKKGEEYPHNSWKEGDKIKTHPKMGEYFKKNGLVK